MIPREEFIFLYIAYGLLLIILSVGFFISRNKRLFKNHLMFYGIYTTLMIYVFADEENFKYGASFAVLFYGAIFILTHYLIFIIHWVYRWLKQPETT